MISRAQSRTETIKKGTLRSFFYAFCLLFCSDYNVFYLILPQNKKGGENLRLLKLWFSPLGNCAVLVRSIDLGHGKLDIIYQESRVCCAAEAPLE